MTLRVVSCPFSETGAWDHGADMERWHCIVDWQPICVLSDMSRPQSRVCVATGSAPFNERGAGGMAGHATLFFFYCILAHTHIGKTRKP